MPKKNLIIGAGIMGSAVAYTLSQRGETDWAVVDVDLGGEFSSSERNAGGVRHLWHQAVNIALSEHSIRFFRQIADKIGFQERGYLWLYSKTTEGLGNKTWDVVQSKQLPYEKIGISELRSRWPFIDKTDDLAFAIFGPKDGIINSNALKEYFRQEARSKGIEFWDKQWIESLKESSSGVDVAFRRLSDSMSVEHLLSHPDSPLSSSLELGTFDRVVLCSGAWSKRLLKGLVLDDFPNPIRRQISFFKSETLDLSPYGMIVDTSGVYFHPEGGNILGGFVLKDEPTGFNLKYDHDFFESHLWEKLFERSTHFERVKPVSGWAGLYSYTPDTSGILGKVPGSEKIYELHSCTGRGVMQSYSAAVALTELLLDKSFVTIDAAPLSRLRFRDPCKLLPEALHI